MSFLVISPYYPGDILSKSRHKSRIESRKTEYDKDSKSTRLKAYIKLLVIGMELLHSDLQ